MKVKWDVRATNPACPSSSSGTMTSPASWTTLSVWSTTPTEKSSNMSSNPTARVSPSQRTPRRSMSGMEREAHTQRVTSTCSPNKHHIFPVFHTTFLWQSRQYVFAVPQGLNKWTDSLFVSSCPSSLMFSAGCMWTGVSCMASRLSFWPCRKASTRLFLNTCSKPLTRKNWRYQRRLFQNNSDPVTVTAITSFICIISIFAVCGWEISSIPSSEIQ